MEKILVRITILAAIVTFILSLHFELEFQTFNGWRLLKTCIFAVIITAIYNGCRNREEDTGIIFLWALIITAAFIFLSLNKISLKNTQLLKLSIIELAAIPVIRFIPDFFRKSVVFTDFLRSLLLSLVITIITVFSFKYGSDGYEDIMKQENVTIRIIDILPITASDEKIRMAVLINPDPSMVYTKPTVTYNLPIEYIDLEPDRLYSYNKWSMYKYLQEDSLYNVKIVKSDWDYRLLKMN